MSSIGPQMPPSLAKRKRSPSETDDSPPAKIATHARNDNEIDLDSESESDDGFGPQIPNNVSLSGLNIPPNGVSTANQNKDEISLDDDCTSDFGPQTVAKEQSAAAPKVVGPTLPPSSRVLGPTMPPTPLSEKPTYSPPKADHESESDSDSDDGYGPALPTAASANYKPASAMDNFPETEPQSSAPKRDAWMLAPPTESGSRAPDPTKIKSRGFASGRGATAAKTTGISSIWTETPEEKRRRLENAVLGRADESDAKHKTAVPSAAEERKEQERRRKISEYTQQTRGKSLYEERQEALKSGKGNGSVEEEDDPSKRAFDIKKDMAIGGRLGQGDKKQLINKAANFGDRFQKGSYL